VKVLTRLPGVGPFTALVILAETGDISRFASARQLASWAGPRCSIAACPSPPAGRVAGLTIRLSRLPGPAWRRRLARREDKGRFPRRRQ
jgi:Transposase IS116/IS110/IS902 family